MITLLSCIIKDCLRKTTLLFLFVSLITAAVSYGFSGQKPLEETIMPEYTREVLMSTFSELEPGEKAPLKRIIDNLNPLNLVNYYGNEPVEVLWSSIPENQKPFTVILIIPGHTLLPSSSLNFLEDTADICEAKEIPYAIQNINGEIHSEERLPVAYLERRFAQRHDYFFGLNAAELYNGVTWRGEIESNNSQYIIDCVRLTVKYGAYFFWTDTNMNYSSGMVLEWFESNEAFYTAFKNNAENIVLMNKESYGTPSTYSVMQGLWLAGLVGNWGVASDWWHWQVDGDKKSLFGEFDEYVDDEWDMILSYPENMFVQSMMLVMSCGGTCFKAEAPNFSTSAGGVPIAGFEYGISPLLNSIISGEIQIPTKAQVLQASTAAVLGKANYPEFNYKFAESNLYPSTGRYRIIPLLPANLRLAERAVFEENGIVLINKKTDKDCFNKLFAQQARGDTYAMRTGDNWYYINNVENKRSVKSAEMTPVFCSAQSFSISAAEHTSAIVREKPDGLSFYISNYRTDKKDMVKTVTPAYRVGKSWVDICREFMTIDGNGNPKGIDDTQKRTTTITVKANTNAEEPQVVWMSNIDGTGAYNRPFSYTKSWNSATGTLTIKIMHNGVVKFDIILANAQNAPSKVSKGPLESTLKKNGNSTAALQKLLASLPEVERSNYIDYSYLKFNAAFEKARLIISEGTYTKAQIFIAGRELESAYAQLVDITKYKGLLEKTMSGEKIISDNEEVLALTDHLLKEMLSNNIYVKGRSNNLEYMPNYKDNRFHPQAKSWLLERRYASLEAALERLQ